MYDCIDVFIYLFVYLFTFLLMMFVQFPDVI